MSAPPILLASSSPRRREILDTLGFDFAVRAAPDGIEQLWQPGHDPLDFALETAREKCDAVASLHPEAMVIAADTVVVDDQGVLEKPADAEHAAAMLARLSGVTHRVCTGVAVAAPGPRQSTAVETTRVTFRDLGSDEIAAYVATGEPLDKAGAYGIQGYGATLVRGIEGCYFNVMGLPVFGLLRVLREVGWEYRAPGRLRPVLELA